MALKQLAAHETVSFADLKSLAGSKSPCITIVTTIPNPVELTVRLKNAVRSVQNQLIEQGADDPFLTSLLQPIEDVVGYTEAEGIWANALILFRSPEVFQYYFLYGQYKDQATVSERFQIKDLLSTLAREQRFHLLALSEHNVRLLRCTPHTFDEVSLQGFAPQDMRVWMNNRQPDHVLDNRSTAGPSLGSMKGVLFGTNSDRDRDDEYRAHFFNEVDKGVTAVLHGKTEPLILAGVDSAIATYRRVNNYPHLLDKEVLGSSDGLPDRELYARARDVIMELPSAELSKALAGIERLAASRIASDPVEIFNAATEGRVADLFLSDALNGDYLPELMNTSAIETLRNSGRAFSLRPAEMPVAENAAAILRF